MPSREKRRQEEAAQRVEGRTQLPTAPGPQGPFWGANLSCQRDAKLENLPLETHYMVRKCPARVTEVNGPLFNARLL